MTDRKRFYLYNEYESFTDDMTDEEAGILFKTILRYENGGEIGDVPVEIKGAWSFIRKRLENGRKAYEEACEEHRKAGEQGGRPKETKNNQNNQTEPKKPKVKKSGPDTDTDTDTDTDKDTEKDTEREKPKRTQASLVGESNLSDPLKDKLMEWLAYKKERREGYKETGLKSLITQVEKHEQESGSTAVIDLINECMANGWKGIIWEKLKPTARNGTTGSVLDEWAAAGRRVMENERRRNDEGFDGYTNFVGEFPGAE